MSNEVLIYNEQIKQVMNKYGLSWFKFDEYNGNVTDSKGTAIGVVEGVTRVVGWDGTGYSMSFDGVDDYVQFNDSIISSSLGIRFKIKTSQPTSYFISNTHLSRGFVFKLEDGKIQVEWNESPSSYWQASSNKVINDGEWHDIFITWSGKVNEKLYIYIDDFNSPDTVFTPNIGLSTIPNNLHLGKVFGYTTKLFNGQIDDLQLYSKALTPSDFTLNKTLILTEGKYKTYSNGWINASTQPPTAITFLTEGMDVIPSQINDLTTDFEIVNWTDEIDANRKIEIIDAIPSPQFIHTTNLSKVTSNIVNMLSSDLSSISTTSNVRYLLTDNNITWKKWNGTDFVDVSFSTAKDILNIGMTYGEIMAISDWSKWTSNKINIGVYLQDDDTTTSKVGTLGFVENSSNQSTKLSNVNFYILNTTAKIELDLQGLLLSGHLSDLDSTRVQYKVTLNGQPYYPLSGDYTSLSPSPQNIEIAFKSSEIKMNDWNTLRVDFKDYFGTEDYWQTTFVGNYSALMFMDVDGNYYSDDIGKVLQYLDFGTIVAGEVTVAHEVVIKNQYGYAVKDLQLEASRSNLPEGVDIQLSKVDDPFEPEQSLLFEDGLNFEDQTSFYVRMVTDVDSVPNDTKSFNIFVKASRKGV